MATFCGTVHYMNCYDNYNSIMQKNRKFFNKDSLELLKISY